MAISPDDFRPCPACGQLVRLAAIRCRFCGTELSHGDPLPVLAARAGAKLRATQDLEEDGRFPHEEAAYFGSRFRPFTIGLACILGTALLGLGICAWNPGRILGRHADAWLAVATIGALAFGAGTLLAVGDDLRVPRDAERVTPEMGLRAFFMALAMRRWLYAYACLLPGDKDHRQRPRDAVPVLNVRPVALDLSDARRFQEYWQPLVASQGDTYRSVRLRECTADRIDERNAICTLRYRCTSDHALTNSGLFLLLALGSCCICSIFGPILVLLIGVVLSLSHGRGRKEITLIKWVHRVGEKWYVVCGDIHSGEDMLPKLYHDCMDRLCRGDLPPEEVLRNAAMVEA